MFIASRAGLEALAEEVAAKRHLDMQMEPARSLMAGGAGSGVDWDRWDKLLRTPMSCKVPELKSACKEMGEMVSGTKPELVVRLLAHFGLPDGRRCPVPLRLWLALRQERNSYARPSPRNNTQIALALKDLSEAGDHTAAGALGCSALLTFRRLLARAYGDTAGLMAAHRACLPRLAEIRAERARRAEEERRAFEEQRRRRAEEQRQILQERWQQAYRRQQELHELRAAAGQGQVGRAGAELSQQVQ
ncbi:hypothetical protein CHLRE_08g363367v5 [Chlamydomonas reinhardtii]|uniref:SAP domain-containing protein n=1 Tax=Chlamydomonas reinhardtii TaxID=3055 RepID=A0A2K3DGQ6_CHLRE|nr:uncharacterized protein CHLRE_08g363367v5 [Chlamydomonas reinhardtii]PNW79697.1 hypothetical protein CHLRE_08g363367v5 [Chlamydomonas reinhardtii]